MGSRIRENVKHFFECFCEVVPPTADKEAWIIQQYPDKYKDEEVLKSVPKFAYPYKFENTVIQHYSFVLTDLESKWTFGFCRHDPRSETAIVVLSYLPWHQAFYKFLDNIAVLMTSPRSEDLSEFLSAVYTTKLADPSKFFTVPFNRGESTFSVEVPKPFQLPSIPENRNLTEYYNAVDSHNMMIIFASMLYERRIIFTSKKLKRLSACVQSANDVIYPMIWQHIFIPVLPMALIDYLLAPMPFLIGVPEEVMKKVQRHEIGEVVILDADTNTVSTPFDDLNNLPQEVITSLKRQLKNKSALLGDGVSRAFLRALVQLIGGYRDGLRIQEAQKITFDQEKFIETRPVSFQPFLREMLHLQIFQQFIEERLAMLNNGLGFSDEFEMETFRYSVQSGSKLKQQYKDWTSTMKKEGSAFFKSVKEKANPAVKSAVKTVKDGGKGVKSAYRGLRSRLKENQGPQQLQNGLDSPNDKPRSAPNSPTGKRRTFGGIIVPTTNHRKDGTTLSFKSSGFERSYSPLSPTSQPMSPDEQDRSRSASPNLEFPRIDLMNEMKDLLQLRLDTPPVDRSGNYAKFLKNLHAEQINKLNLKNQHECELLEDLKSFTIKRSALERTYAEELLKLTSQFLNKKAPNIPDIKLEGTEEKWNMWSVWRTVLEENEKLAQARLAAVEIYQQQIADDAKILRTHKLQGAKKCLDQLAIIQKEVQLCVQEVDKTKKFYFDEEHSAHGVRDKARDIEEKLKKKKGGFFTSITSLQKNSAKYSTKREQLDEKSTGARNDYLLCLAAANAHQTRYFVVDLQSCMNAMESGVYEKVAEYLSLMGRTELLTCSAWQNSYTNIRDQAKQLTREYNIQCCYLYYPVLKQHIQYPFEPCDNDPIETITAEHDSAAATLSKEARRWATRIARENNIIKESTRKLQIYNALRESGQKVDPNDQNGPDLETKIEEMKQSIRKAETSKAKAEARIEVLREGGVNVEEWLQEAETLNVQDIQRSASSLSDHPSSDSFYDSDFADGETVAVPQQQIDKQQDKDSEGSQHDQFENAEVDAMLEQERQRIEQLTAGWDDPTQIDWGNEETTDSEGVMRQESTPSITLLKCTALYSYTAQNPDELTIVENEQLEVVGEGDGDGWLRARNYKGEEGYVPHNYLDVEREQTATTPGLVNQISFSSVDYTVDNEEEVQVTTSETNQSPEQDSVISIQAKVPDSPPAMYCCALYDYDGEGDDELTLEEGQIIKIISKCAHSVDDGWWKGELEGRIGNFPSLVVEECDEFGEPLTNQWDETPPQSAPPVFTPPEVPEFLMGAQVIITQPTPSVEHAQQPPPVPKAQGDSQASSNGGFSIALSRDQHQQYGSQFQGDVPTIDVPSVEIVGEDEDSSAPATQKSDDIGLGVAQIVITAATPMMEEAEHPFPPPEDPPVNHRDDDTIDTTIPEEDEEGSEEPSMPPPPPPPPAPAEDPEDIDVHGGDSTPFVVSSSTGSDGETTGPSTAENSVSHVAPISAPVDAEPKQVVGGRASIPDELEPHQLARLQDLKESNA